jgi:hypothetical protein
MFKEKFKTKLFNVIFKIMTLLSMDYMLVGCEYTMEKSPSTAFFYSKPIPEILFSEYDRVVVEYENLNYGKNIDKSYLDKIFIYTSVGEAEPWRKDFSEINPDCFLSYSEKWGSYITSVACKEWQDYVIEKRIKPAWELGIRGFFLDTLDSYMSLNISEEQKKHQTEGLIELVTLIHEKYPGVKLILNRGFHILPNINGKVVGIAVESLFLGWDQDNKRFYEVSNDDRQWLLEQLNNIKEEFNIPIVVIDYANLDDKESVYKNVSKIKSLGFTPWITSPYLDTIGVGKQDVETSNMNF